MSRSNRLLINNVENCVDEMLESVIMQNQGLKILEGHRVIVREDCGKKDCVSTISGGGSGHEPFAGGFVGVGMLTAAVAGSIFASPPPVDILAAIEATASSAGTLLIVANYTGDRLNFGIALERAKSRGHKIKMVVVGEDCALESSDKTAGRRGLVGIMNIMKIAGALSEKGKSLEDIVDVVERASKSMGTIGVSLSGCSIPGTGSSFHLDDSEMELGLGAHGEAGVKRMKIMSADETISTMINHMTYEKNASRINLVSGSNVSVIMNNLGGLSVLEMHVLSRKVIQMLESKGVLVERFYSGHFMTSLDMAGFNLNILKLDDEILTCLDVPTMASVWPKLSSPFKCLSSRTNDLFIAPTTKKFAESDNVDAANIDDFVASAELLLIIQHACEAVIAEESFLNDLDTSSGDGDCGSTLKRGALNVLSKLLDWKNSSVRDVLMNISSCAETSMGGASGGLYSLFFTAASRHAIDSSLNTLKKCLDAGVASIMEYGKAEPGDRTMLDALVAVSDSLEKSIQQKLSVSQAINAASIAVKTAAENTKNMKAKAGRASYVASSLLTQADPGAMAVVIWIEAISKSITSS